MLTKKKPLKNQVTNNKNAEESPLASSKEHAGCCQPNSTQMTTHSPSKSFAQQANERDFSKDKKTFKTRITVKYDAGYPNQLYIRGKGANLSWDKGLLLKNTKNDEWIWETDTDFANCEFKILINDQVYENGENHHLNVGSTLVHTPHFC